jgi:glycerol-3-phosphate dehydrogenase
MPITTVPKVIREKLGEDVTEALVELINQANGQTKADALTFAGERFERRLSEVGAQFNQRITEVEAKLDRRIAEAEAKLNQRITEVEVKLDRRITEVEAKLDHRITDEAAKVSVDLAKVRTEMAEHKADLLRWMFIFWVGQVGALLGILFAFFRK